MARRTSIGIRAASSNYAHHCSTTSRVGSGSSSRSPISCPDRERRPEGRRWGR
jgi:hypothetical protein